MTNAISTLIPRKPGHLPEKETTNNKHKAPIPLFPEPGTHADLTGREETIKLKLRRNPSSTSSQTYEKIYAVVDPSTVEAVCRLRERYDEISVNTPLSNANAKFAQFQGLIKGNAQQNWNTVLENMDEDLMNTDEGWTEAMKQFMLCYCTSDARRVQNRFMQKYMGLPSEGVTPGMLWMRLGTQARYLKYLPCSNPNSYLLENEELRFMLVSAMPNR